MFTDLAHQEWHRNTDSSDWDCPWDCMAGFDDEPVQQGSPIHKHPETGSYHFTDDCQPLLCTAGSSSTMPF